MVIGIVIASVLLVAVLLTAGLLFRDVRTLHRSGKSLTDKPGDAAGVSPGAMTFFDNLGSH